MYHLLFHSLLRSFVRVECGTLVSIHAGTKDINYGVWPRRAELSGKTQEERRSWHGLWSSKSVGPSPGQDHPFSQDCI